MTQEECGGAADVLRRQVLQGALAAAAVGALGTAPGESATAADEPRGAEEADGSRAIDIHAHYFPQAFLDVPGAEGKDFGFDYRAAADDFAIGPAHYEAKFTDLTRRLADMDARGVETHALSLMATMIYWAPPELQHRLAHAWNDAASAAHEAHPRRFVGLATLPMRYPDRAGEELNRAGRLPGIRGVYLGTNIDDVDLDDPPLRAGLRPDRGAGLAGLPSSAEDARPRRPHEALLSRQHHWQSLGYSDRLRASHLWRRARPFAQARDLPPPCRRRRADPDGALGPRRQGEEGAGAHARLPSDCLRRFTYDTVAHSPKIMKFVIDEVGIDLA